MGNQVFIFVLYQVLVSRTLVGVTLLLPSLFLACQRALARKEIPRPRTGGDSYQVNTPRTTHGVCVTLMWSLTAFLRGHEKILFLP